ncbi:MAG: hypothetical protein ACE5GI_02445 [Candidatus Aminicenantales bacterium]
MKNYLSEKKIVKKIFMILMIAFFLGNLEAKPLNPQEKQQNQIQKAKIYQEIYPIISESDLYCSFFVLENESLDFKIVAAEKEYEKQLLTDGDVVYVNKGRNDGLKKDQLFLVFEIGPKIKDFGHLAFKRGRARIKDVNAAMATARIEKSCGQVMVGNFLVPFEEKEGLLGKDLGYQVPPFESPGVQGNIIYLQRDYRQIGSGQWALIDIGQEDGLQVGQQLIIYRIIKEGAPLQIIGNLLVIDTQKQTSTVKILSCKDVVMIGDHAQPRT